MLEMRAGERPLCALGAAGDPSRRRKSRRTASPPRSFQAIDTIPFHDIIRHPPSQGLSHQTYVSPHKFSNTHSLLTMGYHGRRERGVTDIRALLPSTAWGIPISRPAGRNSSWKSSNQPPSC